MGFSADKFRSLFPRLFTTARLVVNKELQKRFSDVYVRGEWGSDESRSGPGSIRGSDHVNIALEALERVVAEIDVKTMSDVPCGDFNWIWLFLERHPSIDYIGYDIVTEIIDTNRQRYKERQFHYMDLTMSRPRKSDLIICKDLLNHLSFSDIKKSLKNLKGSGSTYLLATNDFTASSNEESTGQWGASRPNNLLLEPFSLAKPLWNNHIIGLWRLQSLAV